MVSPSENKRYKYFSVSDYNSSAAKQRKEWSGKKTHQKERLHLVLFFAFNIVDIEHSGVAS
jgi:hypothetical protein